VDWTDVVGRAAPSVVVTGGADHPQRRQAAVVTRDGHSASSAGHGAAYSTSAESDEHAHHGYLVAALERNAAATARDVAADIRDAAAAARDRALIDGNGSLEQLTDHQRRADDDRRGGAQDRQHAAADRGQALRAIQALASELAKSGIDPLTGARARAAGLSALDHEGVRCRRTNAPLTVAFVDVIGLKALNDTLGHAAGDALLGQVVANLRAHLRPYDLIIRLGGDEFLCAMPGLTMPDAHERFRAITSETAEAPDPRRVRVGFAGLRTEDTIQTLIARADEQLTSGRRATDHHPPSAPHGQSAHSARRVDLNALLAAVEEFHAASLELLAWEFRVSEDSLRAHWDLSIDGKLITSTGIDPVVGETMFTLTDAGKRYLSRLPPATPAPDTNPGANSPAPSSL
jgi:diguanylate cyclase (GGDEF)-like protein